MRHVPLWLARLLAWACRALGRLGLERARVLADGLEFAVYSCSYDSVGEAVGSRTVRSYYEAKLAAEREGQCNSHGS